jgi:hypothetical protein
VPDIFAAQGPERLTDKTKKKEKAARRQPPDQQFTKQRFVETLNALND